MSTSAVDAARFAEVKSITCETLELDPDEVTDTSLFREEHGSDSLGAIEVLAAVERRYGVIIDQGEMPNMINIEAVYAIVAKAAGW
jgi:acyl carrier protein